VPHTIRLTRHGPVITPVDARAGGELIAVPWAAHGESRTWRALRRCDRAKRSDDFAAAVDAFDNPPQNAGYADTAGYNGRWMGGTVPLRGSAEMGRLGREGGPKPPPVAPVPGWTGEWDWVGTLPLERHPHVFDPPQGYVVTANNRQATGPLGDLVG